MIEIKNRFTGEVIVRGDLSINELVEINRANLRGVDLRGAYLHGVDLRGVDLRGAYLIGADLLDANLRGANLEGAVLPVANLEGANLEGADLLDANLRGANLSGANLRGANLRGANLSGANLRGVDLEGEILTKTPIFIDLTWRVTITTEYMRIGCQRHAIVDWATFSDEEISNMEPRALEFWNTWKNPLLAMCEAHKK